MIFYKNKRYNGIPLIKFITLMICFGIISCSMTMDSKGSAGGPNPIILTVQDKIAVANKMIEILNQLNKDPYWVSFLLNSNKIMWFFDTKETVEKSYVENFFSNFSEKFYMAFYSYYNIIKEFYGEKQNDFSSDQLNKTKEQWMKILDESMATIKDNLNNNMIFFHLNECFLFIQNEKENNCFFSPVFDTYESTFDGKNFYENINPNLIFTSLIDNTAKKQTTLSSKGIEFINTLLKEMKISKTLSSGLNETTTAEQLSPEDKETLTQLLKKLIDFDDYVEKSKMIPYFGSNDEGANKPVDDSKKENSPLSQPDLPSPLSQPDSQENPSPSPMDEQFSSQFQQPTNNKQQKLQDQQKPQDQPKFQGQEKQNKLPDNSLDLSGGYGSENKDSGIVKKFGLGFAGLSGAGSCVYLVKEIRNGKKNKKSKSIKKNKNVSNGQKKRNNRSINNSMDLDGEERNNNGIEI